jgi:mRNA interferase HigB
VRIITKKRIHEFSGRHADGDVAAREWYTKTKHAHWQNLVDVRSTFNSVDYVGNDRYVFNLGGNKYRLVAIIRFKLQKVFIRFIGTHADYDKINDIKNI